MIHDTPQPNCAGNPWPYDVLHDTTAGPDFELAVRDARAICGGCALQTTCLGGNRHEPWAAAILGIDRRNPAVKRDICGTVGGRSAHSRHDEKPCAPCREAETRARMRNKRIAKRAAEGMTDELRAAHSAHVRLRSQGVPLADIPEDVVDGERTYQAVRQIRRKKQQEDAA